MMLLIKRTIFLLLLFLSQTIYSQYFDINGVVKTNSNAEGIHVINTTSKFNTVTNEKGEFIITAKLNDTILFSSLVHKTTSAIITSSIIKNKRLIIELSVQTYELDEVFIGNTLSGNLLYDINKLGIDPSMKLIDVGIPVNESKELTSSERALHTAGEFKPIMLLDLVLEGKLEFDWIINGISGRTKRLKQRVQNESKALIMEEIINNLSSTFFCLHKLEESKRNSFFYFCEQSSDFLERCSGKSELEILIFLEEKLVLYNKKNMK